MNIFLKLTIIFLLSLFNTINASQKEVKHIAKLSSSSLYNIDKSSLQKTINAYIASNPKLKALKIVETLSGETYYQMFREGDDIFFDKKLPKNIKQYNKFTTKSKYENEIVGEITAYFENGNLISLTSEEQAFIDSNPIITIQNERTMAPLNFHEFGEAKGFSVEIMEMIAQRTGLQIKYIYGPSWKEFMSMFQENHLDVLLNIVKNEERSKFINFTDPYVNIPHGIILKKQDPKIKSFDDLIKHNKTITYVKGYFYEQFMKKNYPNAKVKLVNNDLEALQELAYGQTDAVLGVFPNMQYTVRENHLPEFYYFSDPAIKFFKPIQIRLGINKNKPELLSILQKGLASITPEEKKELSKKWILSNQQENQTAKITLTQEQKNWLAQQKDIKIGIQKNWPPLSYIENNNPKGLGVDFLNIFNEHLGGKIKIIADTFKNNLEKVKTGTFDGMIDITQNKKREEFYHFTSNYAVIPHYIISYDENKEFYSKLTDLSGKTVAVEKGYGIIKRLQREVPNVKFKYFDNTAEALEALSSKKADAYVGNRAVINHTLKKNFISNIKFHGKSTSKSALAIGINKEKEILRDILQKVLENISSNEKNKIFENYVGNINDKKIKLTKKEQAWLNVNKSLKYVYDINWAPFEWENELGEHTGIIKDIFSLIEERSGLSFIAVKTDNWAAALKQVKTAKADMHSAIGEFPEGKKYLNFTKNHIYKTPYVFVTRLSDTSDYLNEFAAISNKKIAVVNGYEIQGILKEKKPEVNLLNVSNFEEGFNKVQNGELDIMVVNGFAAKYFINRRGYDDLKIATKIDVDLEVKIALNKNVAPEALSIIDKAIGSIGEKELSDIYFKWTEIQKEETIDWTLIYEIIAGALVILLLVVYWNRKLKQSVDEKTIELSRLLKSFDKNVIALKADINGNITYVSNQLCDISGYSKDELIGKSHKILKDPNTSTEFLKNLLENINQEKVWKGESRNQNKNGDFYWVYSIVTPEYDNKNKLIGYSDIKHDVTAKKEVEELTESLEEKVKERTHELHESQEQFTSMVSNVPGVIYRCLLDEDWTMLFISDEIEQLSGYPVNDYLNNNVRTFTDIIHPDDVEYVAKEIESKVKNNEKFHLEYRIITKDGTIKWVSDQGKAVYDESGKIGWLDGAIIDIDATKKAQQELEDQKLLFQNLFSSSPDAITLLQGNGKFVDCNEAALTIFGVESKEEFLKITPDTLSPEMQPNGIPSDEEVKIRIKEAFEKGKTSFEWLHIRQKNQENFYADVVLAPFIYQEKPLIYAIVRDITEKKASEEEIAKANKEIHDSHRKISSSIKFAALIQDAIIPENNLFKKYFSDYLTIWQPKDIVGGDIYLFEELRNEDECMLMVIDCTGHGVPGAFVTMLIKAIERQITAIISLDPNKQVSPAWILEYFNKTMKKLLRQESIDSISNAGLDGGILYYNRSKNIIRFAGAEIALFYTENNSLKTIRGDRHSIGYKKSDANYKFTDHEIEVKEGMNFYMTTDGYIDQNGGEKSFPFGKKRFKSIIENNHQKSFADQQKVLLDTLEKYQGNEERNDDITIVGVKI